MFSWFFTFLEWLYWRLCIWRICAFYQSLRPVLVVEGWLPLFLFPYLFQETVHTLLALQCLVWGERETDSMGEYIETLGTRHTLFLFFLPGNRNKNKNKKTWFCAFFQSSRAVTGVEECSFSFAPCCLRHPGFIELLVHSMRQKRK